LAGTTLLITGCEMTREITFNDNNSGTIETTTDMSGMIGMAKMSGQGKDLDKVGDKVIDTTIMLSSIADSIEDISADDKALVKKGKLRLQINMPDEKFLIKVHFPFSNPSEIGRIDQVSSKLVQQALKKQLAESGEGGGADALKGGNIPDGSVESYYITTYSKGLIEKKLNKEKYAKVGDDEGMQALKQMAGMGAGNSTTIINLPRPAIKAEGKNLKLSDDKKKVTITNNAEDFFDDGASFEFRIEY
jgi:hypothetical protein